MKRVVTILITSWAAISFIGTIMPIPDELQFLATLPNSLRWLALLIALIGIAALKYPRHFSWNGLKNLLKIGISWESGSWYFLGMKGSNNPADARVTGFQLHGFNNSKQTLNSVRAFLILLHGEQIPLRVTTSDGKMDTAASVNVAPTTKLYVSGQFGELKPNDFIANYAPLRFVLEWADGKTILNFHRRKIEKLIRRFENESSPKPDTF